MNIQAERLNELASAILARTGARADEAQLVADNLVNANLAGHDSHGVVRLPAYCQRMRDGEINVKAQVRVVTDSDSALSLDGAWGFGQVATTRLIDLVMAKAKQRGTACGTLFNCNDIGRVGTYTNRAAEQGFIALMTVNDGGANANVAPWGGKAPLLSTNPLCMSAPMQGRPPLCMDMATSICAGGKVIVARQRGEQLPPGLIIDADGRPATDPADFFGPPHGALLPMGAPIAGHKGFALGLLVDILSGALTGAGCSGSATRDAQGVFCLIVDVAAFTPMADFLSKTAGLVEAIKATPAADGANEVRLPGDRELQQEQERRTNGIFVEDATWQQITTLAQELGVDWAERRS